MMKNRPIAASLAAMAAMSIAYPAFSQVSEDGMGKVLPVEIETCNYNDGQDASDLDKVINRWSEFMDDNGIDNYAAWTLTPYFHTSEQDFDFIWLGAYADGNAMGAGINTWLTKGGDLQEDFEEVATCDAHIMLSSAMYKEPASATTPASGIFTMMDCKLNEGSRYSDIKAAELKWAAHLTSSGSAAGYWHWFPTYGGGDSEFDYKVVFGYTDFVEVGSAFEHFANGGGRDVSRGIFGDLDECDDARAYVATSQRAATLR